MECVLKHVISLELERDTLPTLTPKQVTPLMMTIMLNLLVGVIITWNCVVLCIALRKNQFHRAI